MEIFIEFLTKNYIWFLVVSIVLLFSLIGFLVETSKNPKPKDETENKEKPIKEKKKKEKKSKDKKEAILEDNTPTIEELIKAQESKEQKLEENSNEEKTEELTYDKPLIIDDKEDIKK